MKTPAKLLLAALLGATVLTAAIPAFSQSAQTPPAPPAVTDEADDQGPGDDEGWGWGWRRHGGHHGEHHAEHQGKGHGEGGGKHRGRMMMMDADGNGVISADEASSMAEGMFLRHDQNGDDVLDEAEFTTPPWQRGSRGWFGWGAAEAEAVQKIRKDKFALLDSNKDGKLNKAEFFADVQQKLAAADTDKDGKVTPWEFRALPRM